MNQTTLRPSTIAAVIKPITLTKWPAQPLVSVLLANYNYAKYLECCIDSVLAQSYPRWELIVCDDGSTDESISIVTRYLAADQKITLLRKSNGGHTSALNMAFSVCRGDVISLIDSDDVFVPNKLELLIRAYTRNPLVGMVVHRVIRVDQKRRREGVYPLATLPDGWLGSDILNTGGIIPCAPPTSAISFRREVGRAMFPLPLASPFHMCPDQVIMRIGPLVTPILRLPEALAEHRVHKQNAYSSSQVSLPSISRQLELSKALWQEQHRFLSNTNPDVAAQLKDHDESASAAVLQYMAAKLRSDRNARSYLRRYLAIRQPSGGSKWHIFWHFSIYMPNFIFRWAVSTITGQGSVKQFVARLKKLV